MLITKLQARNFKILKAVEIEAGESGTVVVSGKNGAGKTSVLDAIAIAIAGKRFLKDLSKPIREGETNAEVSIETDSGLLITRRWTEKNSSAGTLSVTDKDNRKYSSPQAFLEGLIGEISFDPLSFANSKPQDQKATLLELMGVDLGRLDEKRDELYSQRTICNREHKSKVAILRDMAKPADNLPAEEITSAALIKEQQEAMAANAELDRVALEITKKDAAILDLTNSITRKKKGARGRNREAGKA